MQWNNYRFADFLPEFILLIALLILIKLWLSNKKKLNLPPGPKGYPIIGCLPMIGKQAHLTLHKWAEEYGDVYGYHIGSTYIVVISDPILSKEVFSQTVTSDRPANLFQFLEHGVGFSEANGKSWTEQRRFTMREMRDIGLGTNKWDHLLQEEAQTFVNYLEDSRGKPINYEDELLSTFSSNVLSFMTGKQLPLRDRGRDILRKGAESFQVVHALAGLHHIFPNLYKLAVNIGIISLEPHMTNISNFHKFLRKEIEDCKEKNRHEETYITGFIKEMEEGTKRSKEIFNEENLIGNVQSLVLAGTDTNVMSLTWLLLVMASHPDVQEKVHQELDSVLDGSDEPISYLKDRNRFPYICATINESQRWRTIAPLNVYHSCNTDIKIKDYDVPAGSYLLPFIWAFHNNPKYWPEPEKFKPERFLNESECLKKDGFAPFSHGKRMCIGVMVAYMEIFAFFTSIMRKFDIVLPPQDSSFDLEGELVLTLRAKPHKLQFVLREKLK